MDIKNKNDKAFLDAIKEMTNKVLSITSNDELVTISYTSLGEFKDVKINSDISNIDRKVIEDDILNLLIKVRENQSNDIMNIIMSLKDEKDNSEYGVDIKDVS